MVPDKVYNRFLEPRYLKTAPCAELSLMTLGKERELYLKSLVSVQLLPKSLVRPFTEKSKAISFTKL